MQPFVHVVDDDSSFRKSTVRLLRACGYGVMEYELAQQFLDNQPEPGPGCLLLDIRMPRISGLQLQSELAGTELALPIVFLSGHGDIPTSVQAIKAGAEDFLSKPVSKTSLINAITRALARQDEAIARRCQSDTLRARKATLTPREDQVFALVVRGKINKQIAHELGTTERTIKAHRQKVMSKLQAKSFLELVSIAERLGITEKKLADDGPQPHNELDQEDKSLQSADA